MEPVVRAHALALLERMLFTQHPPGHSAPTELRQFCTWDL
jgi:hypothetical protein